MDKLKYNREREGIKTKQKELKALSKSKQKEIKTHYKSERASLGKRVKNKTKKAVKPLVNIKKKVGRRFHRKREVIKKLKLQVEYLLASMTVLSAIGTDEDVEKELKFIADNLGNV